MKFLLPGIIDISSLKYRDRELPAKVKATNRAYAMANRLCPILQDVFRPFVGQTILKATGTLLAKIEKLVPEFPKGPHLQIYLRLTAYSLDWMVKTDEFIDPSAEHGTVTYAEAVAAVGRIDRGVLIELATPPNYKTDYKVEDIIAMRDKADELKKQYEQARDQTWPFGPG